MDNLYTNKWRNNNSVYNRDFFRKLSTSFDSYISTDYQDLNADRVDLMDSCNLDKSDFNLTHRMFDEYTGGARIDYTLLNDTLFKQKAMAAGRNAYSSLNNNSEKKTVSEKNENAQHRSHRGNFYPVLLGVTNFFSSMFHNITSGTAMFAQNRDSIRKDNCLERENSKTSKSSGKKLMGENSEGEIHFIHEHSPPLHLLDDNLFHAYYDRASALSYCEASKNSSQMNQNKTQAKFGDSPPNYVQSVDRYRTDDSGARRANVCIGESENIFGNFEDKMQKNDYEGQITQCMDKMVEIRSLLGKHDGIPGVNSAAPETSLIRSRIRNRPKKVFIEPHLIKVDTESFTPQTMGKVENSNVIQYQNYGKVVDTDITKAESVSTLIKTCIPTEHYNNKPEFSNDSNNCVINCLPENASVHEIECVQIDSPKVDISPKKIENPIPLAETNVGSTQANGEVISKCEDKMARLKALLSGNKKTNTANSKSTSPTPEELQSTSEPIDTMDCSPKFLSSGLRKSPPKPIPNKTNSMTSKKHKNPNSLSSRREKDRRSILRIIEDDLCFGQDIDSSGLGSSGETEAAESSHVRALKKRNSRLRKKAMKERKNNANLMEDPCQFNEITGKFKRWSSDCESDDSFVIVFSDSPVQASALNNIEKPSSRQRIPSECGSEDSFIICFESDDVTPQCFMSTDVFVDRDSETDSECVSSDSEYDDQSSDCDSDSGRNASSLCNFNNAMSRTIGDLTDESLYDEDIPKCKASCLRNVSVSEVGNSDVSDDAVFPSECVEREDESSGLSAEAKTTPVKKVRFSTSAPRVHLMHAWLYAARAARMGPWERAATDRERFKRRIADVDLALSWVLKPQHRNRVRFQRFMPWWHAERRRELAEKKQREEKQRKQEEKLHQEEEQKRMDDCENYLQKCKNKKKTRRLRNLVDEIKQLEDEKRALEEEENKLNSPEIDDDKFIIHNDIIKPKLIRNETQKEIKFNEDPEDSKNKENTLINPKKSSEVVHMNSDDRISNGKKIDQSIPENVCQNCDIKLANQNISTDMETILCNGFITTNKEDINHNEPMKVINDRLIPVDRGIGIDVNSNSVCDSVDVDTKNEIQNSQIVQKKNGFTQNKNLNTQSNTIDRILIK